MKYIVRVDTKPGVVPSMGATFEIETHTERSAQYQAKRRLADAACVLVSKVRVRKIEAVKEAG